MVWTEPVGYLLGLFGVLLVGALLPIRVDQREDHIILTIAATVTAGILGMRSVLLVWGAIVVALPVIVAWCLVPRHRDAMGWRAARRSMVWLWVTGFGFTVGFVCGNLVYAGVFGRDYPLTLGSTGDMLIGAVVGVVAWVAMMAVRVLSLGPGSGPLIARTLDPFESMLLPYVLPLMGGFPIVVACLAMYRAEDPWPSLIYLWWCFPLYAATAIDLHRRRLAQELRRDRAAKQRLAAIGEVSARIVHQSRHQVGLMGWSIHRLRGLLAGDGPPDVAAMRQELDQLSDAKDRLGEMLASELLHERGPDGDDGSAGGAGGGGDPEGAERSDGDGDGTGEGRASGGRGPSLAGVVAEVCEQLRPEADHEGVALIVSCPDGAGVGPAPAGLRDVVFNLVDNAIDAATEVVEVEVAEADGAPAVVVADDGPGLDGIEDRAFEPFFTTKSSGTGMGLAIADAVVGDLGGELRYQRLDGRTRFVVTLPHGVIGESEPRLGRSGAVS